MYQTDPKSSLSCLPGEKQTSLSPHTSAALQVRLNIGTVGYDHKPTKNEIAAIVADFASPAAQRFVTLTELMRLVTEEGRPFTPALLATPKQDGKLSKCNECFTNQQVFALDFDNSGEEIVSLAMTLKRSAELDLIPFGAYHTPSSTPEQPKYRILFCLERPAVNERNRKIVMHMLLDLFPSADQGCKDAARHFNGVRSGQACDPLIDPTGINSIAALALAWQADIALDKINCSRRTKSFAARHGLQLQNNRLALVDDEAPLTTIKCEEIADTTINIIELATKSSISAPPQNESGTYLVSGGGQVGDFFVFDADQMAGQETSVMNTGKDTKNPVKNSSPKQENRWDRIQHQLLQCPLMQTLFRNPDPDIPLTHNEFFHLATHFINIRGADAIFEEALERVGHNAERRIEQYSKIPLLYQPQRCLISTCRHIETCPFMQMPGHTNIFSLKFARGRVRQLRTPDTISLDEAREQMPSYFDRALESKHKICVVRADCGAGKTHSMILAMIEQVRSGKKVLYAAPTHRLLNETYAAILGAEIPDIAIYRWPDLIQYIEIDDAELAADIKHFWATRHYGNAATKICQWAQRQVYEKEYYLQERSNLDEQARDILDYLSAKDHQEDRCPALWLVTHARLVFASVSADIAFIDEDPLLKSLLPVRQCRYSDLNRLLSGLRAFACDSTQDAKERQSAETTAESIAQLLQTIWKSVANCVTPMPPMDFPSAGLLRKVLAGQVQFCSEKEEAEGEQSDFLEFLTSSTVAFVCPQNGAAKDRIVFVGCRRLPERIEKYIVASASASRSLYEAYLTGDIEFLDMPAIIHQGQLILHPEKSFANWSLLGDSKIKRLEKIQEILQLHPGVPVICSKTCKNALPAEEQERIVCTFGAAEGLNSYQGSDLVVIGLLNRPDYIYKLLAVSLGHKLGLDTTLELANQRVRRKGFEFYAFTFDNELLQEIQLSMVETELEQAVGRARLVSHECRVDLFTNIPLLQCSIAS